MFFILLLQGQGDFHQSKFMHVFVIVYHTRFLSHIWVFNEEFLEEIFESLAKFITIGGHVLYLFQESVGFGLVGFFVISEWMSQIYEVVEN